MDVLAQIVHGAYGVAGLVLIGVGVMLLRVAVKFF
jgi:hypothetical protein